MNHNKNIIGPRVRKARLKLKPMLTQLELSRRVKKQGVQIDRAGIAKIETGIRCVYDYEIPPLAKALGVSVDWLLALTRSR